jgi:hypothetical protein
MVRQKPRPTQEVEPKSTSTPARALTTNGYNNGVLVVVVLAIPQFVMFTVLFYKMGLSADCVASQEALGQITSPKASAAVANTPMGVAVPDIIQPTFPEFRDFMFSGPRKSRFRTGHSWEDLLANTTGAYDPLFAGMCRIEGPARVSPDTYSATWLSSKETFVSNRMFVRSAITGLDGISLEAGFMWAVRPPTRIVYRPVDMFDFFVHHLSGYDKFTGVHPWWNMELQRLLEDMIAGYRKKGYNNPSRVRNGNVLAILPYYSGVKFRKRLISNRVAISRLYLRASILAHSLVFPNIVVVAASHDDYNWITYESGLNKFLYDVQLLELDDEILVKLPFGSNVVVKEKLLDGSYDRGFDWVYYSETDQLPHLRDVDHLLQWAMKENAVLVPHRGQPVWHPRDLAPNSEPQKELTQQWFYEITPSLPLQQVDDIRSASCCFDRTCPAVVAEDFKPIKDGSFTLFQQHESFAYLAGTGNVQTHVYKPCKLSTPRTACLH